MEIKFKKKSSDFYKELIEETNLILTETKIRKAKLLIQIKFAFYFSIFIILYFNLFNPYITESRAFIYLNFIALGLFGILLAFNCSHDCVHNTFSKSRKLNNFIYYITFNLQGVNSRLWKIRHIASHHIFPNVDGCDADIDNNPFIRLSECHPKKNIFITVSDKIRFFDFEGNLLKMIKHRSEDVMLLSIAWHKSGDFFVTGDYGDKKDKSLLQYWNEKGELIKSIDISKGEYRNLAWNKKGDKLASASDALRIWNTKGNLISEGKSKDYLWGVSWNEKGDRIITSSLEQRIILWNNNAKRIKTIE